MAKVIESGAKVLTEADKRAHIVTLHKKVFSTPEGQELLEFLMAENHFVTGTFEESPNKMYFKEGQRSVICGILERVDIPMSVVREMTENVKDNYSDEEEKDSKPQSFID